MKVEILYFGIVRDLAKKNNDLLDISTGSTIDSLKNSLIKKYDQLDHLSEYAFAVNEAYVTGDHVLNENDVVAIIPPVSGG